MRWAPLGTLGLLGCFGGDPVALPAPPAGAQVGLFVTNDAYRSFGDPIELGQRPFTADQAAYALYYRCDLATMELAPEGPLVVGAVGETLPATDARYRLSIDDERFVPLASSSSLDDARVHSLHQESCYESVNDVSFPTLASTAQNFVLADPELGALLLPDPAGSTLYLEDGRVVQIDVAFSAHAGFRNPTTGHMFLFEPTAARNLRVAEVDGIMPAPGATSVTWTVFSEFVLPINDDDVRVYWVSGVEPVICDRAFAVSRCNTPDGREVYVGGAALMVGAIDAVYALENEQVTRITAAGFELVDLPPMAALTVDDAERAAGISTAGRVQRQRADGAWFEDTSVPVIEVIFKNVNIGEFGVITLSGIGTRWYRPLGAEACGLGIPFTSGAFATARHTLVSADEGHMLITWVHPKGGGGRMRPSCGLPL